VLNVTEIDQLAAWKEIQEAESKALKTLRARLTEADINTSLDPLRLPITLDQGARKL
jgi:hypothetical protein